MKKIIALSLVLVSALIFSGCGSSAPVAPASTPPVTSNTINIKDFAFSPSTLTIKRDTTVTWTNNDSAPHQIKSTSFNSSELANGQSFSFTFPSPGTFDYSCSVHPSMSGKIIVE